MSNAYEIINNSLNDKKRNFSFPPSLLDQLTTDERKEIEKIIIKHCLIGDNSCFQYIDKIQCYDPTQIFVEENMSRLSLFNKTAIFKKLFDITNDKTFVDKMLEISKNDINSYSMLTLMYEDDQENKDIKQALKAIAENADDTYKLLYNNRIESVDSKPKMGR